ncbi:MAG TPA: HAD family hydrolase [Burkholderiaceae bacterium]
MKLVIFDLDDTLVDFATTRQVAHGELAKLLEREGIEAQAYLRACTQVDRPLFVQFEQGYLTRQEYRLRRFADPFGLIGLAPRDDLVLQLNKVFMDCVNDSPLLFDDVQPVLAALRARGARTAILTNGPSDGQRRKLKATGLDQVVDHVAIGEEVGVSKPLAQAFHNVVERFSVPASEALMVGDSPELDYDGALRAGLTAVLLDRDERHRDGGRRSIRTLAEVLSR